MTDDQIAELAIQAGSSVCTGIQRAFTLKQLKAFAQLVRNATLEEAAKYCEVRFSDGAADIADGIREMKS